VPPPGIVEAQPAKAAVANKPSASMLVRKRMEISWINESI
jgi:hypothetical protein